MSGDTRWGDVPHDDEPISAEPQQAMGLAPLPCPFACGAPVQAEQANGLEWVYHPIWDCPLSQELVRLETWNTRVSRRDPEGLREPNDNMIRAAQSAPDCGSADCNGFCSVCVRNMLIAAGSIPNYVPQDIAEDCVLRLEATGYGKPGHANTLWAMVRDACAEVISLRVKLASEPAPPEEPQ